MKYTLIYILTFFLVSNLTAQSSLTGKITDKVTGEAMSGVSVYVTDLKTGAITGADGTYRIDRLPHTKLWVQVSFVGYKSLIRQIDVAQPVVQDFEMEQSITEINEVVVTGLSKAAELKRTPTPISVVSRMALLQNSSTNMIDALASLPGVSQITTGAGISKPVIRGLGYNRVVVVNDGIRQEGQQWGDEHGVEVDEYSVNKVEILKGPASLVYGSDAMAGVINLLSAPSLPDGKIEGNLYSNYQTNNGLIGCSANMAGNISGMIWDVRFSNKMAHAYQNKYDGLVYNSGFKENAFGTMIAINKKWGYSQLTLNAYHLRPGIVEGERDSVSGCFVKPYALNDSTESETIASNSDFYKYSSAIPYQQVRHYKAVLNNNFVLGEGEMKTTVGFQQNQRQEFGDVLHPNHYGLFFLLNTVNYGIQYNFPEIKKWSFSVGANGMWQTSTNKGPEYLVPEYGLTDVGAFAIAKTALGVIDVSGGVRYDIRSEHGKELYLNDDGEKASATDADATRHFAAFRSSFSGVSGSLGATWQVSSSVYTKLNFSRGFRAPNIAELGSNGEHEGTLRYEIGSTELKPETSFQVDYALGLTTEHISAEIDLFDNEIDHYIFLRKLNCISGGDSTIDNVPVFKFVSGNARLMGGEARVDIHPHPFDWLHFENTFSYVSARQNHQSDSSRYLPFTPAPKWQTLLKAEADKMNRWLRNGYLQLGMDYSFAQKNIFSAYGTETTTPSYTLWNAGMGGDFVYKNRTLVSVYLSVTNLMDVAYQSHLSRLKYAPANNATGRMGVYNMGRNVSFKVIVPIEIQ
jgi:iron complex outermembrane receptor protein